MIKEFVSEMNITSGILILKVGIHCNKRNRILFNRFLN